MNVEIGTEAALFPEKEYINAGFRIRIRLDPHYFVLLDPDPDPHSNCGSGSGSRRAKMTHKNRIKSRIFMFLSTGCSHLRAEGFYSPVAWASFMEA
jgi:hypothetical protein